MKRLLAIVVLGLLWSTNAYAPITPRPPPLLSTTEIALIVFGLISCFLFYSFYKEWENKNYKYELISKEFKTKFYKKVYVLGLVLICLFPPLSRYYTTVSGVKADSFQGLMFISELGGTTQIKPFYLFIEIALITIIYLLFKKNK